MMEQVKSDEISLSEILRRVNSIFQYLLSKWIFLLLVALIGGAIGWVVALQTKPTYNGKLTFVLSTGSKEGGLSGLASQFGLDMSSGSNDVFSGDNIITLFKSQRMIKAVLFKRPPHSNDNLVNIIVKEWQWDKQWEKNDRIKKQFPFPIDTSLLNPIQDSLLREVHSALITKNFSVSRTDKKLSVYEVSTQSTNEVFSCYLTLLLMDETAKFYIETKTSISKLNLLMLQHEADSLRIMLGGAISSTAAEVDRTFALNPAFQEQRAPAQKSQVRSTVLATAYGEVVKNLELAKINLQKETPLYQIIDSPEIPLKISKPSKLFNAISGAIVLLFIACIFLIIKQYKSKK